MGINDLVFRYEPFGIFPFFSYPIPKGNSVGKFGIIKLAGALYTHMVATHRRLLSARILRAAEIELENKLDCALLSLLVK